MKALTRVGNTESSDRIGDVFFVHGLDGDSKGTWSNGSKDGFWPDWLAKDCPHLGIWSIGYEVASSKLKGNTMPLLERAIHILAELDEEVGLGTKPICFITHSMGGLLVKRMLRIASDGTAPEFKEFSRAVRGLIFLSTPHAGSGLANCLDFFHHFLRLTVTVEELKEHSPDLYELNLWYSNNSNSLDIKTKIYYETKPTNGIHVVTRDSANPGILGVTPIPVPHDHITIAKPLSKDDLVYKGCKRFVSEALLTDENHFEHQERTSDPTDSGKNSAFRTNGQAPPEIHNLPFPRNPFFTGRDLLLQRLSQLMETTLAVAISGLPGVGKTQLALEHAYRCYPKVYRAILWARADSYELLLADFAALAKQLNLLEKNESNQEETADAVIHWLETHTRWLLVLDNADDLTFIRRFIPPVSRGRILITTRSQMLGNLARGVRVDSMEQPEATLFLLRRAKLLDENTSLEQASPADLTAAEQIVDTLGGLPLALDQAGAYIEEAECQVSNYLVCYHQQRRQLLQERGTFGEEHLSSVFATFQLCFDKVEEQNPVAADLLRVCAFLHPDAIPLELVVKGAPHLGPHLSEAMSDPLLLNNAIKVLRRYSLIQRRLDNDTQLETCLLHRLVQDVLKETMEREIQHQWAEQVVQAVNTTLPSAEYTKRPEWRLYLPQAQMCSSLIRQWNMVFPQAAHVAYVAGTYLLHIAQYSEAEALLLQALRIWARVPVPSGFALATCLSNLASLYDEQGRYAEAESLWKSVIAIQEKELEQWDKVMEDNPFHFTIATSFNNLAGLYNTQGKYREAEPLYLRALDIRKRAFGLEDIEVAQTLNNLATLYLEQGRYAEAEQFCLQALEIQEKILGADDPEIAASLNTLALLYKTQGRTTEAVTLLKRALKIWKDAEGWGHLHTATSLNNLAELYSDQGMYAEAETHYLKALAINRKALGSDHADVALVLTNLGALYSCQDRQAQAESSYKRAIAIDEKALGAKHPQLATDLNNLAVLYLEQGKYAQAESLLMRASTIFQDAFGMEHPKTAWSLYNLAELRRNQGKLEEAESLYQEVLTIREKTLGVEHQDTAQSRNGLAKIYRAQHKYAEAERLLERALRIYEKVLGVEHLETAKIFNNLAKVYDDQGKYSEAKVLFKKSLAILEQDLKPDHPDFIAVLKNYRELLRKTNRAEEAAKLEAGAKGLGGEAE